MEWVRIVVDLIGHVAWPLAVVILVCLFRGQIRGLLNPEGLESVEAGPSGVKLTRKKIDEQLSAARRAIEKDSMDAEGVRALPHEDHISRMQAIAEIDPPVAVFASAAHLESVLRRRLEELSLLPDARRTYALGALLRMAQHHGLLTNQQAAGAQQLNKIRNEIAHRFGRVEMDEDQAIWFCRLAWELEDAIHSNAPQLG